MARIGIDLDGVVYDFGASFLRYLHDKGFPEWWKPEPQRWEFYEDWGFSLDKFLQLCHDGVNAGVIFSSGDPHKGSRNALSALMEAGHSIHIITDRSFGEPGRAAQNTLRWLDRHRLPYDTITFSADKTVVKTDYMIEDKVENYMALRATDCKPYLLNRPWNQGVVAYNRVDSLQEFVEVVNNGR